MSIRPFLAAAALAVPAAPGSAQRAPMLAMPPLPGFVLAYDAATTRQAVREWVPRGQTVRNYATMVSAHRNPNPQRLSEVIYMGHWARGYIARCPGARGIVQPLGRVPGLRIDCTRHPATGRPETVIARTIAAGPDMYLVFVTFRTIPLPRDTQWARGMLGQVALR